MEDSMQENLLTTEQVAQYLKIDKFTVYRLVTQKNSSIQGGKPMEIQEEIG